MQLSTARAVGACSRPQTRSITSGTIDDVRGRGDEQLQHSRVAHLQKRPRAVGSNNRQRAEVDLPPANAERLGHPLRRQHVPDAEDELLEMKRLRQILVRADLESLQPVLRRVERGHEHHRDQRIAFDAACQTEPRPIRQLDVNDGQVPRTRSQRGLAGRDRLNPGDVQLLLLQPLLQRAAERRVVLDQQNLRHDLDSGRSMATRRPWPAPDGGRNDITPFMRDTSWRQT